MTKEAPFDIYDLGDHFTGDFGDGERVLKDVVGKVRKSFVCHMCAETTEAKTWARILTEAGPEGIKTYRWCALCCQAEIKMNNPPLDYEGDEDLGADFIARERLGEVNRAKQGYPR